MQRTFWAQTTPGVLDYLNKHAPKNASILFNNTPWDSFRAYQKDGMLRSDLRKANSERDADFAVLNHWKYYADGIYNIRRLFGAEYAIEVSQIDGLPLTELYRNDRKQERKAQQ